MNFAYPSRLAALVVLLSAPSVVFAQATKPPAANAVTTPAQKTIGNAQVRIVPSLIVVNARSARLQGQKLTLEGLSPNAIVFADRPVRAAGHMLAADIVSEWTSGGDAFSKDPPNATVSVLGKDGTSVSDVVVVLKAPKLEGDRLSFDVQVLEGDLAGADGPASIFIDIVGMPLTPMSFAGVARRAGRRAAWYRAAPPY